MSSDDVLTEIESIIAIFADFEISVHNESIEDEKLPDSAGHHTADATYDRCLTEIIMDNGQLRLCVVLPAAYPAAAAPIVSLSTSSRSSESSLSRQVLRTLSTVTNECIALHHEQAGNECSLMNAVTTALEAFTAASEQNDRTGAAAAGSGEVLDGGEPAGASPRRRVWLWFHHIKSSVKKTHIVDWADELRLCGICKPGFPGAMCVEGERDDVVTYVRRLKSLQWQAIVVRHEEDLEDTAFTIQSVLGQDGMSMVEETGMNAFAECMRRIGKEDVFKAAILRV